MKRILLMIVLGLTGCVNIYDYRSERSVTATFNSTRSPQDVQECILSLWQKEPLGYSVTGQKTGIYYSVLAIADNVDVYYDGKYTKVNYYSLRGALDYQNGKNKRIKSINLCL